MRSKTRTRKRRGGMDQDVPPPYSPPRPASHLSTRAATSRATYTPAPPP